MTTFNKFIKPLLICILVFIKVSLVYSQIQSRIVGGKLSNIRDAKFLVRVLEINKFVCGGSLVTSRYVLTAYKCVKGKNVERLLVVGGVSHSFQEGERSEVDRFILPKRTTGIDLAVLKLRYPVYGPNIQPIQLCNTGWRPGSDVQLFGWGKINKNDTQLSNQIRMTTVQVIEKDLCSYMHRNRTILTSIMFCASTLGRNDACVGDAGGPAIINDQLCGVISSDVGCAQNTYPSLYTNVWAVRRFIKTALRMLGLLDFYNN